MCNGLWKPAEMPAELVRKKYRRCNDSSGKNDRIDPYCWNQLAVPDAGRDFTELGETIIDSRHSSIFGERHATTSPGNGAFFVQRPERAVFAPTCDQGFVANCDPGRSLADRE